MEKSEHWCVAGEPVTWCSAVGNVGCFSKRLDLGLPHGAVMPLLCIHPKDLKARNWTDLYIHNLYYIFPLPFSPFIPSSPQQSPHYCPCPWVLFPFCSIPPFPHLFPQLAVICSPSMSLYPFCTLIQFVNWIPHLSEVIGHLSFSDWLISLCIMFSRSIHTVAECKTFFYFYGWVVFHCVSAP